MILTQRTARLTIAVLALASSLAAIRITTAIQAAVPERGSDKLADGVYRLNFDGDGQRVKLTDGSDAVLGEKLSASVGVGGTLQSRSNDNTHLVITINKLGPLPPSASDGRTALVVDGLVFDLGLPDKMPADGIVTANANVHSAIAARVLAARYAIEPQLRKHPGHRYEVRWVPGKQQYEVGETVTLTMELKNTGSGPLRFTFGGQQRGPRNNQFRFVAQDGVGGGKGIPDIGDPTNFGGKMMSETLQPGDVFTKDVDLSKWFAFAVPNQYRITGVFEMPIFDPSSPNLSGPAVWDDLAVGECTLRVVAKRK